MPEGRAPTPSDWAELTESFKAHKQELHQLTYRVDGITDTLRKQDERALMLMDKLGTIEKSLETNTRVTLENLDTLKLVKDAVTTGRVLRAVAAWGAGLIITGAAAWASIKGGFK